MGKSALIIVLGTMLLVSFLVLKLNGNSKENLSTTVDMFNQTQARLIANTGVEVWLEKLYADSNLVGELLPQENLFGGSYRAHISGALPTVTVTSRATFQGVPHVSIAEAYLEPIYFPNPPGGIYISTNAVVSAKEIGDMNVSGSDHDVNGVIKPSGDAVWGVGVDNSSDSSDIVNNLLKPQNLEGLINAVTGATGYPSVGVTPLGIDWGKIFQYLANAADQTFIDDIPAGANLGTLAKPMISLVNADASTGNSLVINGNSGAGIMIVNGNITFSGNFEYRGIILCYKNSDLTFSSLGTNQVIGGVIIAGTNINFKLNGTMNVKHSQDAINAVRYNLKANGFKILSWYE